MLLLDSEKFAERAVLDSCGMGQRSHAQGAGRAGRYNAENDNHVSEAVCCCPRHVWSAQQFSLNLEVLKTMNPSAQSIVVAGRYQQIRWKEPRAHKEATNP